MANSICSIDGCERPFYARGWCSRHYKSWLRHGNPEAAGRRRPNGEGLAWILRNFDAPSDGPCVLWPYSTDSQGYGVQVHYEGRRWQPHRLATFLRDGPQPDGAWACHGPCHEPLCIVHVTWRSPSENAHDRVRDGTDIRGEKAPAAKLTREQVREIRQLLTAGLTQEQIARRYGVHGGTVGEIKHRRNWDWLN